MSPAHSGQPLPGWLEFFQAPPAETPAGDPYSDRVRPPAETVRDLLPFLPAIGITRLAEVTNLDSIGIPVWMAIRPNAATLSVSQGKGIDDDAARASALMEATELSIAERDNPGALATSREDLEIAGRHVADTRRFVLAGEEEPQPGEVLRWLEGIDLIAGRPAFVPEEMVGFANPSGGRARYVQTSDGLASGNVLVEAAVHGLCERIERDAMALWSYRRDRDVIERVIDPDCFGDPVLSGLASRIRAAGLRLRLYDVTSDVGVPTFFALVAPSADAGDALHLDVASGSGCHPIPVRAAIRAVTEAAQTRLTTISGARDDFSPAEYRRGLADDLAVYLEGDTPGAALSLGYSGEHALGNYLAWIVERLKAAGIASAIVVPLGGEDYGVAVAKTIVADLEDSPKSGNRRPGRRALRAMLRGR